MKIHQQIVSEAEENTRWVLDLNHGEMNSISFGVSELHDILCRLMDGAPIDGPCDKFDERRMTERVVALADLAERFELINRDRRQEFLSRG